MRIFEIISTKDKRSSLSEEDKSKDKQFTKARKKYKKIKQKYFPEQK